MMKRWAKFCGYEERSIMSESTLSRISLLTFKYQKKSSLVYDTRILEDNYTLLNTICNSNFIPRSVFSNNSNGWALNTILQ